MQVNKKTVLHIANYSAHYRGNFIESLLVLEKELRKKNIMTIYAFICNNGEPEKWMIDLKKEGCLIYYLSNDWKSNSSIINRIMCDYSVNIIHTHFITLHQLCWIRLIKIKTQCKLIMHIHNHSRKANSLKTCLRRIVCHSCYLIACSESVYDSICRDYPKNKKIVANNGLYFQRVESLDKAKRSEYQLKDGTIVCLIFGFDFYRKGVDLAIKAINQLVLEGLKIELLISLSRNFDIVEQNIVEILGVIPEWVHIIQAREDVGKLYNLADIFLSPSREEGLPYSVLEAGYSRCEVIMSDIKAQENVKIPYGIYHKNEDTDSLATSIKTVIMRGNQKSNNMLSVRKQLFADYSLEKWENKIENAYRENGLSV